MAKTGKPPVRAVEPARRAADAAPMPLPLDLIDLEDAAALAPEAGTGELLADAVSRGAIDSYRVGDRLLVRRSEVETWWRLTTPMAS